MSLLRELGDPPCPIDPFELARRCRLRVELRSSATWCDDLITVRRKASPIVQCEELFHELGHFALHRYDVPDSEWGATYVGDALALPRAAVLRDLAELGGDVQALMARHPSCSERVVQRRLAALAWQAGRAA